MSTLSNHGDPGMPRVGPGTRWEMRCCQKCRRGFRARRVSPRAICHSCYRNSDRMTLAECSRCGEPTFGRSMCGPCRDAVFLCGHPRTRENSVMHEANGYRYPRCRTCRAEISRAYRLRAAEQRP